MNTSHNTQTARDHFVQASNTLHNLDRNITAARRALGENPDQTSGNYRINELTTILRRARYLIDAEITGNDPQQAAALQRLRAVFASE